MSQTGRSEMRRGWPIILAAAVGVGTGMSPLPIFSLGVLTGPISAEFGWGRGEIQAFLVFATLGAFIGAPLFGTLMDRYGVRPVVLFSTVAFALLFGVTGYATTSLTTFYGICLITSILGAGTLPVTWGRAVFNQFVERRGLALGLALAGTGFAGFLVPQMTAWLIQNFSWRAAYVGLALLPLVISLPISFWILRRMSGPAAAQAQGSAPQEGMTLGQAARDYRFWVIWVAFFLAGLGTGGVITNIVPMMTDRGIDLQTAARVAGAQGLAVIAGRAIAGYFLDRVWAPILATIVLSLPAVACLMLAGSPEVMTATIAVALVGFTAGADFDLVAYLTQRYFGLKHFGKVYGCLYPALVGGAGIAPALFGRAYDVSGTYTLVLQIVSGCFVAAAVLVLFLGPYPARYAPPHEQAG